MDQEEAKKLINAGGILILEQLPVGSEFGMDCNLNQIGQQFKGIKMIPPGLHLIHYSVQDSNCQQSPKVGFWISIQAKQVIIRKIDMNTEELCVQPTDIDTINKYSFENLPYFDRFLAPYALDTYREWLQLTSYIDLELVHRLQPNSGLIDSVCQQLPQTFRSQRGGQREIDTSQLLDPDRCFHFSKLTDRFDRPDNCSSSELSVHSFDSSYAIQQLIDTLGSERQLLGELQFAFVCFLLCHVYEAFEHWKKLIRVFCFGRSAVQSKPDMFVRFLSVIHFQLQRVPADLFVDIVDSDNFLFRCLHELFANFRSFENGELDGQLARRADSFRQHLTAHYGWDLDLELDDEAPVVVHLED